MSHLRVPARIAAYLAAHLAAALAALAVAVPALAANLTIGLGTDVTAIDPHYHNLTPNNNVAAHLYGYLVEHDEKSKRCPGSPRSGRRSTR